MRGDMRTSISGRVQKHRAGLRACGLRPIQIWVPDTRRPGFADECRRQSRLLRNDPRIGVAVIDKILESNPRKFYGID